MAIPNSGPLGLRATIGNEFYGNATGSDISIHEMSQAEGFSTPDTFAEFYGYSSAVTVDLNGGQSRTGAPGAASFGTMNYDVNAPSGKGFSNSDAQNAAINAGLPNAFTANFTRTGDTSGRWGFTTPDGNFPDGSYQLQTNNMTFSQPSSPLYTFGLTYSSPFSQGTQTRTCFAGAVASVGITRTTSQHGYLWDSISQPQTCNSSQFSGVACIGYCNINQGVTWCSNALNSSYNATVSMNAPNGCRWSIAVAQWIGAPPWGSGGDQHSAGFARIEYNVNNCIDPRVSAQVKFCFPGSTSGTCVCNINANINRGASPSAFYADYGMWGGANSGQYTMGLHTNHHAYLGPNTTASYPYTKSSDIRLKNTITYL